MKVPLDTLDNLQQFLINYQEAYEANLDRTARQALRSDLIQAKTKARLAAKNAKNEQKRGLKQEMALWILTWLENPPVFREWVELRRRTPPKWEE